MIIREGNDCIEIEVVDGVPAQLPSAGDLELSVAVSSSGFSGQGFAWVERPQFVAFLAQLQELEATRRGAAELTGMNAAEFYLRIRSVNRRGHVAVEGVLAKLIHKGQAGPYRHAVEFGFEFDPTLLPAVLAQFQAMTKESEISTA